ncbi:MAG: tetratricopeptide repeat protein [Candidatus Paceibacterota bacterium]|jgi:tetratricopeptide (TPR) repeat protein
MKKYILGLVALIIIISAGLFYYISNKNSNKIADLKKYSELASAENQGKMDDAISIAQDILNKYPEDIQAKLSLAEVYVNKGSHDNKEAEFAPKVLKKDPNNFEAYRIMGYAYEIQESFDKAIISYNKAISIDPNNAAVYNSRGHAFELMGQYQLVKDDYLKAYQLDPNNPNILMNVSRMYLSTGDDQKAKDFAERLVAFKDGSILSYVKSTAYSILGQVALNENKKEEAIKNFTEAINLLPSFVAGYIDRAQARILIGTISESDKVEIVSDLNTALKLNPNSSTAYYLLGGFYEKQKDYNLALSNYTKALSVIDLDLVIGTGAREYVKKSYQEKIDLINKLKK